MERIDWGEILWPALTQPFLIKLYFLIIFVAFGMMFLRVLLGRGIKKLEQKYPAKPLKTSTLFILALAFLSLAFLMWHLMVREI